MMGDLGSLKIGNDICPRCQTAHPAAFDCTFNLAMTANPVPSKEAREAAEVERVARAIDAATRQPDWADRLPWEEVNEHYKETARIAARAAIRALRVDQPADEGGECICPKCGLRHGGQSVADPGF